VVIRDLGCVLQAALLLLQQVVPHQWQLVGLCLVLWALQWEDLDQAMHLVQLQMLLLLLLLLLLR
jgi:hypothetical protein